MILLDSGAYSLFKEYTQKQEGKNDFSFYETDTFWEYVDNYAEFVLEHKEELELYVSVDIIFNPELSWKVQKYLENKGITPLPVFHAGEDFSWLKKYIDNYDYIGIGGLAQISSSKAKWYTSLGDPAFNMICDDKGMPRVKVHGFAMTSPDLIINFPWFSCDSSSWMQYGKYALILVPKKQGNKFIYDIPPHTLCVSSRKEAKIKAKHFDSLSKIEKTHVYEYLEMKGVPFGKSILKEVSFDRTKPELPISVTEISSEEEIIEEGVCNNGEIRDDINLEYFLDLEDSIEPWPHVWKRKSKMITRLPF